MMVVFNSINTTITITTTITTNITNSSTITSSNTKLMMIDMIKFMNKGVVNIETSISITIMNKLSLEENMSTLKYYC